MSAFENYQEVARAVAQCAEECGRDPQDVTLIAVSKTVGADVVRDAVRAGAHDFGENRPDSLTEKEQAIDGQTWHFIGNIQSRKIPQIVASASLIHSLFEERHALKINQAAEALGKIQDVLVEVNVSGEDSKSGCAPETALELVTACAGLPHVRVRGLMTMAPQGDSAVALETFQGLAQLLEDIRPQLPQDQQDAFTELSMGMSEDWREAISAGATMVRVGRAIFSDSFLK